MDTAFLTVTTGTLVFILGQILQRFFLQPLADFKNIKFETHSLLENYIGEIRRSKTSNEVKQKLRELAVKIEVTYYAIPFARQLGYFGLFGVVKEKNIAKVFGNLLDIGGVYSVSSVDNISQKIDRFRDIFSLLGIKRIGLIDMT